MYIVLVPLSLGLIWVLGVYNIEASLRRFRKCTLREANFVFVQVQMFTRALLSNIQHLPALSFCLQFINGHQILVPVHEQPPSQSHQSERRFR